MGAILGYFQHALVVADVDKNLRNVVIKMCNKECSEKDV